MPLTRALDTRGYERYRPITEMIHDTEIVTYYRTLVGNHK